MGLVNPGPRDPSELRNPRPRILPVLVIRLPLLHNVEVPILPRVVPDPRRVGPVPPVGSHVVVQEERLEPLRAEPPVDAQVLSEEGGDVLAASVRHEAWRNRGIESSISNAQKESGGGAGRDEKIIRRGREGAGRLGSGRAASIPVARSSRMLASTSGNPVCPRRHARKFFALEFHWARGLWSGVPRGPWRWKMEVPYLRAASLK
mmetsp:Transcript_6656/g.17309  ORF Transcript_6656/g.17309 Transcript_6656/m.17309 type:complete len:205 (+) Transcript_6656:62-676(+)